MNDPTPGVPAPDGATRLHLVIGDPIAQVKAPGGISRGFAARGANAMLLPARVAAAELDAFVAGALVLCAALLLLFVALPVAVALAGAFVVRLLTARHPLVDVRSWRTTLRRVDVWGSLGMLLAMTRVMFSW